MYIQKTKFVLYFAILKTLLSLILLYATLNHSVKITYSTLFLDHCLRHRSIEQFPLVSLDFGMMQNTLPFLWRPYLFVFFWPQGNACHSKFKDLDKG